METKKCRLVFVSTEYEELEKDSYVEYTCYNLNRTTNKALGKIKNITNKKDFVLGNQQYYKEQDLTHLLLYVVSDDKIEFGDKFLDLENYWKDGEPYTAGDDTDLHLINDLKPNFKKIIAYPKMIGFSKDTRHGDESCHLCVPVEAMELNEIIENGGVCEIEMKDGEIKLVKDKITFVLK